MGYENGDHGVATVKLRTINSATYVVGQPMPPGMSEAVSMYVAITVMSTQGLRFRSPTNGRCVRRTAEDPGLARRPRMCSLMVFTLLELGFFTGLIRGVPVESYQLGIVVDRYFEIPEC